MSILLTSSTLPASKYVIAISIAVVIVIIIYYLLFY
jgi:hypothetical protein